MGSRGQVSKFTTLKTPPIIEFDWKDIELLLGQELSTDARSRIEYAVDFYYAVPKSTKLEDGKVPMSMLLEYSKKLNRALNYLEKLPEAAQHSLMIGDLRVHVWHASRVAKPEEDKSSMPWDLLILKLCEALGYLGAEFPKTKLTETSLGLPKQYKCLCEVLRQAGILNHIRSEAAFAEGIYSAVIHFEKFFNSKRKH